MPWKLVWDATCVHTLAPSQLKYHSTPQAPQNMLILRCLKSGIVTRTIQEVRSGSQPAPYRNTFFPWAHFLLRIFTQTGQWRKERGGSSVPRQCSLRPANKGKPEMRNYTTPGSSVRGVVTAQQLATSSSADYTYYYSYYRSAAQRYGGEEKQIIRGHRY